MPLNHQISCDIMMRVPPQTLPSTSPVDENILDYTHTIPYVNPVSIVLFSIFGLLLTLLLPTPLYPLENSKQSAISTSPVTDPIPM